MTTRKIITYATLVAILLLVAYRGILIYKEAVPPTTITTPISAPAPVSGKLTYTITVTREVVAGTK